MEENGAAANMGGLINYPPPSTQKIFLTEMCMAGKSKDQICGRKFGKKWVENDQGSTKRFSQYAEKYAVGN